MATNITIHVSGINEFVTDYRKFRSDMSNNMIVPLDDSAAKYLKVIHANFNNKGQTFGSPWPPLSPATLAAKKRAGFSSKTLVRTGALQKGFGRQTRKSMNEAYVYNTQSYAIIHQEGATVKYGNRTVTIPKRILADVDETRIEMVTSIFSKWFNNIVSKNSL